MYMYGNFMYVVSQYNIITIWYFWTADNKVISRPHFLKLKTLYGHFNPLCSNELRG
jgi:hypothetical protein